MTIESHTCTSELEGNSRNCSSSKVPLKQRQKVEVYAGRNGRWLKFVTTYVALPKLKYHNKIFTISVKRMPHKE
ncbi:hypothetical protein T01_1355 [Trichinella spiralis]|uniref:Uncharacterized protein n=1 Tax=Trichinella spiralis TaxID=6334 RepID=A0A0V1BPU2_TRISP|nr:hypothetical protein T01_1355 [Trichinella spiralis]